MGRSRIVTLTESKKNKMLDLLGNPPFLTTTVTIICVVLFLFQIAHNQIGAVCFLPSLVATRFQLHRIYTYAFFHANFFHILFNIIAWLFMAKEYERDVGSLGAIYTLLVIFLPIGCLIHGMSSYLLDTIAGTQARNECAIGISGVLFAILVVNIERSGTNSVSFFGLFSLPSKWYPWLLLFLLQLLSPRLSFFGHLAGILVGYGLVFGYFNLITPSDYKLMEIEEYLRLYRLPLWKSVQNASGIGLGMPSGLPRTQDANDPPYSQTAQRYWQRVGSWFSGRSSVPSDAAQPFAGRGHVLGGGSPTSPVGRIPPNSRLLVEAEATTQNQDSPQTSEQTNSNPPHEDVAEVANGETEKTITPAKE